MMAVWSYYSGRSNGVVSMGNCSKPRAHTHTHTNSRLNVNFLCPIWNNFLYYSNVGSSKWRQRWHLSVNYWRINVYGWSFVSIFALPLCHVHRWLWLCWGWWSPSWWCRYKWIACVCVCVCECFYLHFTLQLFKLIYFPISKHLLSWFSVIMIVVMTADDSRLTCKWSSWSKSIHFIHEPIDW